MLPPAALYKKYFGCVEGERGGVHLTRHIVNSRSYLAQYIIHAIYFFLQRNLDLVLQIARLFRDKRRVIIKKKITDGL